MQTDTNSVEYQRAKKRVKKLRGFYEHLFVYLVVNTGLFLLNILTSPSLLVYMAPAWMGYWSRYECSSCLWKRNCFRRRMGRKKD